MSTGQGYGNSGCLREADWDHWAVRTRFDALRRLDVGGVDSLLPTGTHGDSLKAGFVHGTSIRAHLLKVFQDQSRHAVSGLILRRRGGVSRYRVVAGVVYAFWRVF